MGITGNLRWQDVVNLALGFWIGVSPWLLGYSESLPIAMWNALFVGGAIIVLSVIDIGLPGRWEEWLLGALGVWLAASPIALGFLDRRMIAAAMIVSGIAVLLFAAWPLFTERMHRGDEHAHG